jgi:hypothetical protein
LRLRLDDRSDHYRIVILDKTNFDEVLMKADLARQEPVRFHIRKKRPQPAPPGCGLSTSATPNSFEVVSPEEVLGMFGPRTPLVVIV